MAEDTNFGTKLKRVIKSGLFNFWRSGFISFASVLVMIITLTSITSVIFIGAILNLTLDELRSKVDVNVYFIPAAQESDILSLKTKIEALPEVAKVEYVSREAALDNFKAMHAGDETTLQALGQLDDNPLGAVLNIKAKEPSQYESVANFLNQENILSAAGTNIIDKVNYAQNKTAIDKLSKIIDSSQRLGLAVTIALLLASIVITFNTVRLAIYVSRDEISVMRLVGASRNYIRGPFVITGILYGFISGIITLLLFLPATYYLGNLTKNFFIGFNVYDYYINNLLQMSLIILGSGIGVGALSSFLAVRRHLKV